ncbi:MAG TPA: hypothetical protein V6C58_05085 [Allocoleopsis sp.]
MKSTLLINENMELKFVPIEEFYFALTLAVRTLEDMDNPALTEKVRSRLQEKYGVPSTIAAASQNNFNYVFEVQNYDNTPAQQLVISIADWQGKLRLSSDYGWTLDSERKPIRTEKFNQRPQFTQQLKQYLSQELNLEIK